MQFKKFDDKIRVYKKGDDIKILIDGAEVHKKGMLFGSKGQEDENGRFFAEITKDENVKKELIAKADAVLQEYEGASGELASFIIDSLLRDVT